MSNSYDLQQVRAISQGDESFVSVLVEAFLQEIPPDMEAMQIAVNNDNHKMAYQFAHKMKPNLEMFGIDLLKEILAIEKWSNSRKTSIAIQPQLDKIVATLTIVISELKEDFLI